MRTLDRNKQTIYLCKRKEDEYGNVTYSKPEEIKISINTVNSRFTIATLGPKSSETKTMICNIEDKHMFSNGDRLYVEVEPDYEDVLASKADYEISGMPTSLNVCTITIKRLLNGSN